MRVVFLLGIIFSAMTSVHGLPPPAWFIPPVENPFVPPRTDKGETEERPAYINSKADTDAENEDKKRTQPILSPKRMAFKPKDKQDKRPTKKKSNLGLGKVTNLNFGTIGHIRRSSEHRVPIQKEVDGRLVKSTQNLDLNSLVEAIHTQTEFEERLKQQETIVGNLQRLVETCSDAGEKDALSEKLIEQVTLLSEIRMHVKIMEECHLKGYLEMRLVDPNFDTQLVPFTRYWFYLNFPRLCCYEKEGVREKLQVLFLFIICGVG